MPGPTTPSMNLILPALGGDAGTWSDELNTALTLVDGHTHEPGKGVKVPTAGLNINADLSLAGNGLTNIKSLAFSEIAALSAGADVIYVDSTTHELFWRTHSGVDVQLTSGSALNVAAFTGGIGGDYSAVGAALNYDAANTRYTFQGASPTFNWSILASGDLRLYQAGTTESVYTGIQVAPGLASNYNIVLPAALPTRQTGLTLDSAGQVAAKGGTLFLGVQNISATGTYTPTTGTTRVVIEATGGGGGGGGVSTGATQCGAGGGASGWYAKWVIGDGTTSIVGGAVTIGAAGTGGANTGGNGANGGDTSIVIGGTTYTAPGGGGGTGVSTSTGYGVGGSTGSVLSLTSTNRVAWGGRNGDSGQGLFSGSHLNSIGGAGGSNQMGQGGSTQFTCGSAAPYSLPGITAFSYGGGGSGACITTGHTGTAEAGGDGAPGQVFVWEYM